MVERDYDVAIIGGGHNGLVAAAYLAKAGKKVIVLEKLEGLGGAAVSERTFPGVDANLSRYSYLVSLLPKQIIDDLGLDLTLAPRRYGSYTPEPGTNRGLLIDKHDESVTKDSFQSIGAAEDFDSRCNLSSSILHPKSLTALPDLKLPLIALYNLCLNLLDNLY